MRENQIRTEEGEKDKETEFKCSVKKRNKTPFLHGI